MNPTTITITRLDAERLERLLDDLPDQAFPEKDQLLQELLRANIVEPADVPPDVVTMNSKVTFRIEESGKEFSLKLVYPKDADGSTDRISVLAPVGAALLGVRAGQAILWPMPGGASSNVRVIRVDEQPERSGNFSL